MQRTDFRFPAPRPAYDANKRARSDHGGTGDKSDEHDDTVADTCDRADSYDRADTGEIGGRDAPEGHGGCADSAHAGAKATRRGRVPAAHRAAPSRGRVLLRRVRRIVVWTLCALLAVVLGTATRVWWVARQDARPTVDAILVLGASQYDGRPSPVLRARLEHALALYRDGVAPRIITVGGNQPGDRFTEAGSGRRWLIAREVAENSVLAVPKGSDTLQSIRAVAEVMWQYRWQSVVIVTDPWQALRSRSIARAAGLDASASPTRQGPAVGSRSTQAKYVGRETAAYLHWWLLRRSSGLGYGVI